jgi:uncharacterized membrane protein YgdD (TMEM256/DUF423 family)
MNKSQKWIVIAGLSGLTGAALGAFGAHILKDRIADNLLEIYKTGIFYHLIHSSVILAIALSGKMNFNISSIFFSTGIILFSFSLYIYSITEVRLFALITPLGGVSFIIGWIILIWKGIYYQKEVSV